MLSRGSGSRVHSPQDVKHLPSVTELLHSSLQACEIARHTHRLLTDSKSLPGTLVTRFLTCTWETNTLESTVLCNIQAASQAQKKANSLPKTDWYSAGIQSHWVHELSGGKHLPPYNTQAYANDGYLLNTCSRESSRSYGPFSLSAKEHKVLSNTRQFMDGMKRFLMNEPDTQLMFAIQRERVKVTSSPMNGFANMRCGIIWLRCNFIIVSHVGPFCGLE